MTAPETDRGVAVFTETPDGTRLPAPMLYEHGAHVPHWSTIACTECPKAIAFVNATPSRVQWYLTSHRCGPADQGWQG